MTRNSDLKPTHVVQKCEARNHMFANMDNWLQPGMHRVVAESLSATQKDLYFENLKYKQTDSHSKELFLSFCCRIFTLQIR